MKKESAKSLKARTAKIDRALERAYPDAGCALEFEDPLQCLVSTVLSAQCTDKKVNTVTPTLFAAYPDAAAFAAAGPEDIEPHIRSLGLFRAKAKNIVAACRLLVDKYGGKVPPDMDELTALPGVGRKTANCVLLNAFGLPGVMCDTHMCRVTRRLGLHELDDPDKIEMAIKDLLPESRWGDFSHRVIVHGRECCHARTPRCDACPLNDLCPFVLERRT